MVEREKNKIDFVLLFLYLILITLGWFNLYATNYDNSATFNILENNVGRQLIWIAVSLFIGFLIIFTNPYFFSSFAYLIYGFIIFLLVFVLFYGTVVHGSKSWFQIGPARIQPAEFAKFATALALAKFINDSNFSWDLRHLREIFIALGIVFLPAALIVLQPDMGSALTFIAFIFVLYREGMPGYFLLLFLVVILSSILSLIFSLKLLFPVYIFLSVAGLLVFSKQRRRMLNAFAIYLFTFGVFYVIALIIKRINVPVLLFLALVVDSLYFLLYAYRKNAYSGIIVLLFLFSAMFFGLSSNFFYNEVLKEHQRQRIDLIIGKLDDPKGAGYNLQQSKIAISSGGFWGKGFLKGTITKYDFVPEEDTDFIYCTLAEEWGFFGTLTVFLLFFALIARIVQIAERQTARFTRVYAYSVASFLFVHVAINIGMTVGLFPIIGIPLPFFSYGGSAMLGFSILIFILLNLDTKRNALL